MVINTLSTYLDVFYFYLKNHTVMGKDLEVNFWAVPLNINNKALNGHRHLAMNKATYLKERASFE